MTVLHPLLQQKQFNIQRLDIQISPSNYCHQIPITFFAKLEHTCRKTFRSNIFSLCGDLHPWSGHLLTTSVKLKSAWASIKVFCYLVGFLTFKLFLRLFFQMSIYPIVIQAFWNVDVRTGCSNGFTTIFIYFSNNALAFKDYVSPFWLYKLLC